MREILGLYGMVGTGKSTLSKYLESKNFFYINQDLLGHEVLEENNKGLIALFGKDIAPSGKVDRQILSQLVFEDSSQLKKLTTFSHPLIIQKTNTLIKNHEEQNIIIEGAFFYKVRDLISYTKMLYIEVNPSVLIPRLIQRGHSLEWIERVLESQKEIANHKGLADYIFDNSEDTDHLYTQIQNTLFLSQ